MERETLIDLIRQNFDPEPKDWPRHRGWDDGAEDIADAILACMVAKPASECTRCPKCGLEAATLLHRFCTRQTCPVKATAHERKYGAATLPTVEPGSQFTVDQGRPACGQGDEWARKPTDRDIGGPKS